MEPDFELVLDNNETLNIVLEEPEELFLVNETPIADGIVEYEGVYEFTPALYDDIEADTSGKLMRGNVLVHPIPIFEVGNPQGGTTITIGA